MAIPSSGDGIVRDVMNEVDNKIDDILSRADTALVDANTAAEELQQITEDTIAALADIDYSADTSAVDKTFVAPTEVTLLDPTTDALISSATIDGLFDRALSNKLQDATAVERDAVYKASAMGLGMLNPALLARLKAATDNRTAVVSEVALENAVQTGVWMREDAKTIYSDLLKQYTDRIQKEGTRLGWSQMQINDILTRAKESTDTALAKTAKLAEVAAKTQEVITQLNFGLVSAMYAAANLSMGGRSNVSFGQTDNESKRKSFNYSGETVDANPDW